MTTFVLSKTGKQFRSLFRPFAFSMGITCAILFSLSARTDDLEHSQVFEFKVDGTNLSLEIMGIPDALIGDLAVAYAQVFHAANSCKALDNHPDVRNYLLKKMKSETIFIAGDKEIFTWTCDEYLRREQNGSLPTIPRSSLRMSSRVTIKEGLCWQFPDDGISTDSGGSADYNWWNWMDVFYINPDMVLTPYSFSDASGKLSWLVLEYLLDRYSDVKSSEKLARDCIIKN